MSDNTPRRSVFGGGQPAEGRVMFTTSKGYYRNKNKTTRDLEQKPGKTLRPGGNINTSSLISRIV